MNNSVERLSPAVESRRLRHSHHQPSSSKAGRHIADLQAELDEAKRSLDRANKRVNHLVGEKNQLSALLEKREDQIDRLNRELGTRTSLQNDAGTRESNRFGTLIAAVNTFRSAATRTRGSFIQWSGLGKDQATDHEAMPLGKGPGMHLVAGRGGNIEHRIVSIVLFGLDKSEIERLLPIIERDCSSWGMKPLCLIDDDAFELLRGRGLVFEYLPPEKERRRFDSSLNWDLYLQRRLAIIRRKWNPVRIVAFGPTAMNILLLWSSSPFEGKPLPAVFSETEKTKGVEVAD